MSSQLESIYSDELILLAETLGEVKTRTEKLEGEFSTHAKPLEAATNALSAALSGIKALQFHVLDNNLGALSARVEEMRKAVDEQVGVIALELKKADETNAAKAGAEAETLRSEIVALQSQLGSLVTQFGQQLERVEFAAKEEAKKLQLIPGPAGAAGASLNPRGTFIDGEVYNRLDVVSWLGSSYIATVDGVTEKPSKNSNQWQTLASRGGGGAGGVGDFGSLAGVAQINQGGTGQTTRAAGLNALLPDQAGATQYMLLTDGSGTVSWGAQPVAGLPSQTSNSGRLLTTNGSTASWSNAVTVSGSNATVGGSLTVSGTTTADGLATSGFFGGSKRVIAGYNTSSDYGFVASVDTGIGWKELHLNPVGGVVKVPNTAASTTTSSGALVVGNGTSGGLGVGGAIWGGGKVHVGSAGYADGGAKLNVYATPSDAGYLYGIRLSDNSTATLALGLQTPTGTTSSFIHSNIALGFGTVGVAALNINTSQQVQVLATTASSSTTTGALVVSGGVGVAGAIYAGGDVFVVKADPSSTLTRTANTNSALFQLTTGATYDFAFGLRNTTDSDFHLYNYGTSADAIKIARSTSVVSVLSSTASTGTSSGALVVSGGVGVAKRIYSGEGLDTAGDNATHISLVRNGTISIGPTSAATPKLQVGGGLLLANTSQSVPAYGDVGPQLSVAGAVITDTSSSGTVSRAVVNSIAASALAASSTTTYTAAASLFVAGAPTANTNVTITNAYAIYTAGGRINFQGLPTSSAGLQAGTLWNDGGTLKIA
jgi:hypothetical protein